MINNLVDFIKLNRPKYLSCYFADTVGKLKTINVPISKAETVLTDGIYFAGCGIKGFTTMKDSDLLAKPDLKTIKLFENTLFVACDILKDGIPFVGDTRFKLKEILNTALNHGYTFKVGLEYEYFLFKDNNLLLNDNSESLEPSKDADVVQQHIVDELEKIGISIYSFTHEESPSQYEISTMYCDILQCADNAMITKHIIQSIASKHGLIASFMPKPLETEYGNGFHIHISMYNKNEDNIFINNEDTTIKFISGIINHAKSLTAIFNPCVNSYKRLVSNNYIETPIYIGWSYKNRSNAIRIPESNNRIELRSPDCTCNPYLTLHTTIAVGLDGLTTETQISPLDINPNDLSEEELTNKKIERVPHNIETALSFFENDDFIKKTLGDHIFKNYSEILKSELTEYNSHISNWEIEKFLMR